MITVGGFYPIFVVDGSASITAKANDLGLDNCFWTYPGGDHTPHINGGADLETTVNIISNFMHHLVCGAPTTCNPLAGREDAVAATSMEIFPNPAQHGFSIQLKGDVPAEWDYSILDATGRLVSNGHVAGSDAQQVDSKTLSAGIYLVKASAEGFARTVRLVIQ
jgi:hypothetical protein